MGMHNEEGLDKDILLHRLEDRCREETYEYHNRLLTLMDNKVNGNADINKNNHHDFDDVVKSFSSIVAIQKNMVQLSLDIAKDALQQAFDKCGFVFNEDGLPEKKDE